MRSTSAPHRAPASRLAAPLAAAVKAARVLVASLAVALAGCAGLPVPVERGESHAIADVAGTSLAPDRRGVAARRTRRDSPAFACCPTATTRSRPASPWSARAEKTVDVQYYLIANDATGRQFLAELSAAAARGVRVRLLVDDLYAIGQDALFAALAGQPGFQVRLFNPLPVRGGGFASRVAFSAARVRAHQPPHAQQAADRRRQLRRSAAAATSPTSTSTAAARPLHRHGPAVLGPCRASLSSLFDEFWNSPYAYPVESLLRARQRDRAARGESPRRRRPSRRRDDAAPFEPAARRRARRRPGRVALRAGARRRRRPAQIADNDRGPPRRPGHARPPRAARLGAVERPGRDAVLRPRRAARLETLRDARAKDVRFTVLTNSLATTDEPLVHFGYARYRTGLLKLGVALHELMPTLDAPRRRRRRRRTPRRARSAGCTPSWSSSTTAGSRSAR